MPHVYASEEERQRDEALFLALAEDRQRREQETQAEEASQAGLSKERRALESSLATYFRWMWDRMYPAKPLTWSWHYDYLAEHLQLFYERKTLYLIVNVPPRTGKTELLSIAFPTWAWAKDPLPAFMAASLDRNLADELNGKRRRVIEDPEYQRLFGRRVKLRFGANTAATFENTRGGAMRATSPYAKATGRGGDFLLADDILDPDAAESEKLRETVFDWIDNTFLQRRNDLGRSPLALIEQRVGERDATWHFLKTLPADQVVHINIPLVAEKETKYTFPISGKEHIRPKGDVLQPERFTAPVVAALRKRARVFSTQYQGVPIGRTGKIFKREWWKFYGPKSLDYEVQLPAKFDEACLSVDATFKETKDSDEVAIHAYGRVKANRFLIDRHTERMGFTRTMKAVGAMKGKHPYCRKVYIEDKANGSAIIEVMRGQLSGIIPVEPLGSKVARAEASAVNVESGNWYLPCPELAPWITEWLETFDAFPNVPTDDDVDAFSQADAKMDKGGIGALQDWLAGKLEGAQPPQPPSVYDQAQAALNGG